MKLLDTETYLFLYAAEHAAKQSAPALWDRLFVRIERKAFLARQAESFGDFARTSEDLERYFLPELIRRGDWERFLHLTLVAASLRGLAEDLDESPILNALARDGRLPLAEKLVAQVPAPLRRARARADLAVTQPPSGEAFGRLIEGIREDLDAGLRRDAERRDPAAAEAWCDALVAIAGRLGPELRQRWPAWIAELAARDGRDGREDGLADRAWRAVAESFLRRGELAAEELWSALGAIRRRETVLAFLPACLADSAPADPWPSLRRVRELEPGGGRDVAWRAAVIIMAGQATSAGSTDEAPNLAASWERAVADLGPPPWSEPLVEAGRRLWARLPRERFAILLDQVDEPVARAALAVTRLAESPDGEIPDRTLTTVEAIPAAGPRLHWALCFLLARPREPRRELESQTAAIVHYLARLRWAAPAEDLSRFVDLVARVFPRHLRTQVENVLWTPSGNAATLRALAQTCGERVILDELFRHAEDYAAMAGATSAEGFELRREVLVVLAARLCSADRSLGPLHAAVERLLPEEEDGLRSEVARALVGAGQPELALEATAGLQSRRLALLTRLEIAPPRESMTLPQLYEAVAGSTAVADERQALAALQELPTDVAALARRHLDGMERKGRQIEALIDLAHHGLAYQRRTFRRGLQDRVAAVLPLKEALGVVESDDWLATLTPELVAVGSRLGVARAVAEIQEAMERVVGLTTVAWERRRTVLLRLITGIENAMSEGGTAGFHRLRRRAIALVEWIGRLPLGAQEGTGRTELRRDWHRFLPWLRLLEERLEVAPGTGLARLRTKWTWLTDEQKPVADLCFLPGSDRLRLAASLTVPAGTESLRALACLAVPCDPKQVPDLVARLPRGAERDQLVQDLICFSPEGALPSEVAGDLTNMVESLAQPWVTAWLGATRPANPHDPVGLETLANLAANSLLDLDDPTTTPLRRWVWRTSRETTLPKFARAAVAALATSGKPGCELGLRLFLNAYLAPRMGEDGGEPARLRVATVEAAEQRALQLSPTHLASGTAFASAASAESANLQEVAQAYAG